MESNEKTDEDVKKKISSFFYSLLRSEIPSVYFSFSSSSASFFLSTGKSSHSLFFPALFVALFQLPSYPTALLSLYCRVKFPSSMGNLIRLLSCLSDEKKKGGCCCSRSLSYRLDNLFFFILLSLSFFYMNAHCRFSAGSKKKKKFSFLFSLQLT
jgi:hypothetical protein